MLGYDLFRSYRLTRVDSLLRIAMRAGEIFQE